MQFFKNEIKNKVIAFIYQKRRGNIIVIFKSKCVQS